MAHELLTVEEMAQADALAIESGTPGIALMEAAGRGVADAIRQGWTARPVLVLCGPGNNGGDGFVAARLLADAGWPVTVALAGDREALTGDAGAMAARWTGDTVPISAADPSQAGIIVDALFGAGLSRPLEGEVADIVKAANAAQAPVISVDMPSGVHGTTGRVEGTAMRATRTVTFFRRKPGHLLYPGRQYCGSTDVVEIGITDSVLETLQPKIRANGPALWAGDFPWPEAGSHKYSRGHAAVCSGGPYTSGAARLAAAGAARAGAGAVTVLSPAEAMDINAAHLDEIMLAEAGDGEALSAFLRDRKVRAGLLGPGAGRGEATRDRTAALLFSGTAAVLDADALTCFEEDPDTLFKALRPGDVITPHEGEFSRLFKGLLEDSESRLAAARQASDVAGCVVVLKGPDTIIAAPDGRAAINETATPFLATAGSGDVLAGIIAGLLAQGMPAFAAACAGVWLHGAAGTAGGPGLIASDLVSGLPAILTGLHANRFSTD